MPCVFTTVLRHGVSVGTLRRIRRIDVERLVAGGLTRDQERSLWLHRVVAGRLAVDTTEAMDAAIGSLSGFSRCI
jgi:hypothetical protein